MKKVVKVFDIWNLPYGGTGSGIGQEAQERCSLLDYSKADPKEIDGIPVGLEN